MKQEFLLGKKNFTPGVTRLDRDCKLYLSYLITCVKTFFSKQGRNYSRELILAKDHLFIITSTEKCYSGTNNPHFFIRDRLIFYTFYSFYQDPIRLSERTGLSNSVL